MKKLLRDLVTNKLLMVRALVVGLATAIITLQLIIIPLERLFLPSGLMESGTFSWYRFLTRWALIHGAHGAFIGWVIAVSHRRVRAAALAVFVAFGLPAVLPGLFGLAMRQSPMFLPMFAQAFWPVACCVTSGMLLVGSMSGKPRPIPQPSSV